MKEIALTQGKIAFVDDEDFDRINAHKWCAFRDSKNGMFRATRGVYLSKGKGKNFSMHREVLGTTDPKIHVDHIDGNPLNNTKENLRESTPSENLRNRTRKNAANSSGFRGVHHANSYVRTSTRSWSKPSRKWVAQISINGKRTAIGRFSTAEEAARAFDKAARELYGEFCGRLNFPEET